MTFGPECAGASVSVAPWRIETGVEVAVGVAVAVLVGVAVAVLVAVEVFVGVGVAVLVDVGVAVRVGVLVGVPAFGLGGISLVENVALPSKLALCAATLSCPSPLNRQFATSPLGGAPFSSVR